MLESVLFYDMKEVLYTKKFIQSAAYVHECGSYKIILKCNWIPQDNCVPWAYCMYVQYVIFKEKRVRIGFIEEIPAESTAIYIFCGQK